ncbi:MAG: diguanylate cyclase [Psychromonas sp.]
MSTLGAFLLNIGLFSLFPLYFATINSRLRTAAFYSYISVVLLVGGIAGALYSFPFSDSLHISGGNLAYGAFMMSTVMLIIVERDVSTFRNMICLVVMVDFFAFIGFNFLAWLLKSDLILNPLGIPPDIFNVSLWGLVLGGVLILCEILLLMFIFLQVRKWLSNLAAIALFYTLAFIVIVCADGVLFPLLAFGLSPDLVAIMYGNVSGKLIMAICYSLPMLLFYLIFRRNFSLFLDTPLTMRELISSPRKKLLETLYLYEVRDQQLQRDKQELTKISERDELTALANRRKFDQMFELEWSLCQRKGLPLTLVIGDIDFFKQYNDTYGHQQGDVCLKKVAALWGDIFKRPSDISARIGGEEFAIILPNTSLEQVLPKIQQFQSVLHDRAILHSASSVASYVTMSIGVAECTPQKNALSKDLFIAADRRMYEAKQGGRNQVVIDVRNENNRTPIFLD